MSRTKRTKSVTVEVLTSAKGHKRTITISDLPQLKPVKIRQAATINEITVLLGEDGQVYAAGKRNSSNWCSYLNSWSEPRLQALRHLGVLTKEEVNLTLAAQKRASKAAHHRQAVENLKEACERLGVPVPKIRKQAA